MGNCCGGGNKQTNPGSVLDRVISQASNDDDCLLYKLANYKKGGELVDAYNIGGAIEVEKLIREQFGILMYKEGKGQTVTRTEYLRWKFRNQKHVVIPVEASSATDPLAKWSDHDACWQMQYRGSLGETLLHVLIICDTRLHTRLARILLKCYPKLASDMVEGEEYLGASSLHLAIAYNNNDLVHLLVEAGAKIDQRAVGSFFLPRDQQRLKPSKVTDYEGLAYLGEYPLAWAACVGNESVYNLLLDHGANPDLQDSFGNMILHMVVVTDQLGMYGYALRHPKIVASNGIVNNQGLTPLTLACRLGRASVFREMLELSSREFWRYSNITCSAYPLNALDTIMPDGRTNWNSALFMILAGSKEEHLDMLDGGIIQRLLEEKWKTFAQRQFLKRISIAFVHIMAMSMSIYLRPSNRTQSLMQYHDAKDIIRLGFEIGSVIGSVSYVVFQQGEEIKNQGFISFIKQLPQAPPKAVFLVANFLLLACIPFRMIGDIKTEESLLSFAMVGSWFFMMFFAGAISLTGPFVTMVYSMITGDMLTFGIIFVIFLLGFSQCFYFLFKSHPEVGKTLFDEFHTTWMALYQMTLGSYDYSKLSETAYPNMAKAIFIIFMVMVPILLLNMLIAMMGNTYSQVIERSEKERIKQWAKIVVSLERSVTQEDAKSYIQEYSIKLGGDNPSNELRGVMVIKSKSKTRANQRKGAVSNWKRVGKVTIQALKKRGMTGEEMRLLMWGHRNSLCTPQTATPRQQSMEIDMMNHMGGASVVLDNNGGMLAAGLDLAMDQLAFAQLDPISLTNNINLAPNIPVGDPHFVTTTATKSNNVTISSQPTRLSADPQSSTMVTTTTTNMSTTSAMAPTSPTTLTSPGIPSSPAGAGTPTTSIVASHITPDMSMNDKTPTTKPKQQKQRRKIKFGLRPKIIIFSDKKDLIRVSLDSDDTDSDNLFEITKPRSNSNKSSRRKSIAGSAAGNFGPSREGVDSTDEEDEIEGQLQEIFKGDESFKNLDKKNKSGGGGGGVVNFAFEPEEFAAAEKKITNRVPPAVGVSSSLGKRGSDPSSSVLTSTGVSASQAAASHQMGQHKISSPSQQKSPQKQQNIPPPDSSSSSAESSSAAAIVAIKKEVRIEKEREEKEKLSSSRPKSAKPKVSKKTKEPSSSTEALISDKDSSSPPPPPPSDDPPVTSTSKKSSGSKSTGSGGSGRSSKKVEQSKAWREEKDQDTDTHEERQEVDGKKKKRKTHVRSKSAKNGNKIEPSGSSSGGQGGSRAGWKKDEDDIAEEEVEKPRPTTANDRLNERWSTKDISNMNKLVAWDRDEDEI